MGGNPVFKGSKDVASLIVALEKNFLVGGVRIFIETYVWTILRFETYVWTKFSRPEAYLNLNLTKRALFSSPSRISFQVLFSLNHQPICFMHSLHIEQSGTNQTI